MVISVPISWGELIDKITILEIKRDRIKDAEKLVNINRELQALKLVFPHAENKVVGEVFECEYEFVEHGLLFRRFF